MTSTAVERSSVHYGNKTIGYSIRRSARRTTVSIAVDPADGVLVTAPRPATIARLDGIVHAKASWIVERLKRQSDRPPAPSVKEFVSGETFLYLGRQYRLRIEVSASPRPIRLQGGLLRVAVPRSLSERQRASHVKAALVEWYTARAQKKIPERVSAWARKLGLERPTVIIADPQKRWGSASSAASAIRINWRVIQAPLSLIDYVVVHELGHLEHPNHTREFWAALGRVMPDYDTRKTRLRGVGPHLEW